MPLEPLMAEAISLTPSPYPRSKSPNQNCRTLSRKKSFHSRHGYENSPKPYRVTSQGSAIILRSRKIGSAVIAANNEE